MTRTLFLLVLLLVLVGARFAGFSVESYGDQVVDPIQGVTTLPDGGVLIDNENALRLEGGFIEYQEGRFIRAREAVFVTDGVRLEAAELYYDAETETVRLTGGMRYASERFAGLSAREGLLFLEDEVALLKGEIRSEDPVLEAEVMVVDGKHGEALLWGRYVYRDPVLGVTLRGNNPEKRLLLRFREGEAYPEATTRVPEEVLARLAPYLEAE
ncbi:hypothetical protein [Marinithermus hydrothermalis]|uniref:OstA family protein n=1 Tax=Marinithermus hydrothermalis (strain DSM 14884 / JCM 11576 / T1) TaxID=869210 RepID=F2NLW6_MARHT|nr:hypothetical protein [Marinithermus hydrothermalis]AEB11223.1 hypothetical protein Marky_0471 [Marinithermus hydrothermalis DSM 14884]